MTTRRAKLPPYIERGGEQVPPHPFRLDDVTLTSFAFRVDRGRVAALCERQLNAATSNQFRYRPALPIAVAYFASTPATEPADRRGSTPESELALWLPLLADNPRRVVWFAPYLFVDSCYPLLAGRDVYGFPKALARFELPSMSEQPARFSATVTTWSPAGSRGPARELELLSVEAQGAARRRWSVRGLRPRGLGRAAAIALAELGSRARAVSFKQIRDAQFPDRACYQAVVESGFEVPKVHDGGHLQGDYLMRVSPSTAYPIIEDLGLPEDGLVDVLAASWLRFDVRSLEGEVYGEQRPSN